MTNIRTFQISDDLFWGYNKDIDLDQYESVDEVIKHLVSCLTSDLVSVNLIALAEKLGSVKADFHTMNFGEMLMLPTDQIIYVCRH